FRDRRTTTTRGERRASGGVCVSETRSRGSSITEPVALVNRGVPLLGCGSQDPADRRSLRAKSASRCVSGPERGAGRGHWGAAGVDSFDDLGVVDALEVDRRYAEVAVPELALDDYERNALVRHLDGVGVTELVRREPPANARGGGGAAQLGS